MLRKLKFSSHFQYKITSPNAQLLGLPNFRSEQASNDHISRLCKQNRFSEALDAFDMIVANTYFKIYPSTYVHLFSACSSLRRLENGREVHNHLLMTHRQPDIILQNHLINMYGKCRSVKDAHKVFEAMPEKNEVSWTSLIAGYSHNQQEEMAMKLYFEMLRSGFIPDQYTLGPIIKACTSIGDITLGRQLHAHVLKSKSNGCLIAQNALITMYSNFGHIIDSSTVFSRLSSKDLTSWGSLISGLSQQGYEMESLKCFKEMVRCGSYKPNEFVFCSVIGACRSLLQRENGRQIHGFCITSGFGNDVFVGCALTDMYARCGFIDHAKAVFEQIGHPDLVSWNAIISGLANDGDAVDSISFFCRMRHKGLSPDDRTIRSLLCACTIPAMLHTGKQLHSYNIKTGIIIDIPVCNSLLTMYTKCSSMDDVISMFNEFKSMADMISWNALITACLVHNHAPDVFSLFKEMCTSDHDPDYITLTNILKACAQLTALDLGKQVHSYTIKTGLELDMSVANGLLDLYSKCGSLGSARLLFDSMSYASAVHWSTLIVGYAQSGEGEEALNLFRTMIDTGVQPNEVTFIGVLTACSHVGLVEEGREIFRTMEMKHGIVPTRDHCSCLVDMLARVGELKEAEKFIQQLSFEPDIVVWKTLLSACRTYGDVHIGKWAAENVLKIDPSNSSAYVLLCNIYASEGNWNDYARTRGLMKANGVRKIAGQSWIEIKNKCHLFSVKDVTHEDTNQIYSTLEYLYSQMSDSSYTRERDFFIGKKLLEDTFSVPN